MILNVFWTLIASKKRIEQSDFFDWLSNIKNLIVFKWLRTLAKCDPMGLKQLFFPKTYKNRPVAGGFAPRPPSMIRLSTLAYSTRLLS